MLLRIRMFMCVAMTSALCLGIRGGAGPLQKPPEPLLSKVVPAIIHTEGNTQVESKTDMTVLFLNNHLNIPFLVAAVRKPRSVGDLAELYLPRNPIFVPAQQWRVEIGHNIMRGFFPEQELLVVEPLDALDWEPQKFPGTVDLTPWRQAEERVARDGLNRIERGGGYWFLIERATRPYGAVMRKEDYDIITTPPLLDSTNRLQITNVTLVSRASSIPHGEPPRTKVTPIHSPIRVALQLQAADKKKRPAAPSIPAGTPIVVAG